MPLVYDEIRYQLVFLDFIVFKIHILLESKLRKLPRIKRRKVRDYGIQYVSLIALMLRSEHDCLSLFFRHYTEKDRLNCRSVILYYKSILYTFEAIYGIVGLNT